MRVEIWVGVGARITGEVRKRNATITIHVQVLWVIYHGSDNCWDATCCHNGDLARIVTCEISVRGRNRGGEGANMGSDSARGAP